MLKTCEHCGVKFEVTRHKDSRGKNYCWFSGNHRCPRLEGASIFNNILNKTYESKTNCK
jgi:hypothetical protein